MKRTFDLVFALAGLMVLSPLFAVVALLIKLEDGGPVFYTQERVGYRGQMFRMLKFRTMTPEADKMGPAITYGSDPRITKVGRWLRKVKVDELPQLINVTTGAMSFVGPRPEVPQYVAMYSPHQRTVLEMVPGITDPASLKYRNESELLALSANPLDEYISTIMPDKIRINLEYASKATLWTDIGVVIKTVLVAIYPAAKATPNR